MPLPKGEVHKKKEIIQDVTLHDLDMANARPQVNFKFLTDFCNEGWPGCDFHDGLLDEAKKD